MGVFCTLNGGLGLCSAHCGLPRSDGPTAAAFEEATWQFGGSLLAVHDTLVDSNGEQ